MFPEILKNEILLKLPLNKKTPYLFFSKKQLEFNFFDLKEKLKLSSDRIFYSVKTNYEPQVIETLKKLNSNFEIASQGELELMKKHNISAERLIFSNPVKIPLHLQEAYNYGIDTFAFDTESELEKIKQYAPGSKVFLRLAVSNKGSDWKLEEKFGAKPEDVINLFRFAEKFNLKPAGISLHVGWNNKEPNSWLSALSEVETIFTEVKTNGFQLQFLNLGGGIPAHLVNQYKLLEEISDKINPVLRKFENKFRIKTIVEPGSVLVANTAVMLSEIYDIINRNSRTWIFLNSGIMQGFPWVLSNLEYDIFALSELKNKETHKKEFVVTGPTLDSYDVFSAKAKLPETIKTGDILCVFPAGAYINSSAKYNHFSIPPFISA